MGQQRLSESASAAPRFSQLGVCPLFAGKILHQTGATSRNLVTYLLRTRADVVRARVVKMGPGERGNWETTGVKFSAFTIRRKQNL